MHVRLHVFSATMMLHYLLTRPMCMVVDSVCERRYRVGASGNTDNGGEWQWYAGNNPLFCRSNLFSVHHHNSEGCDPFSSTPASDGPPVVPDSHVRMLAERLLTVMSNAEPFSDAQVRPPAAALQLQHLCWAIVHCSRCAVLLTPHSDAGFRVFYRT